MKSIAVLIDFDNFFGNDVEKINSTNLEYSFSEIVNLCESHFKDFDNILIRLYGGWYRETIFTKQASTIQQELRNVAVFPKVMATKKIEGAIEIATTLYEFNNFIWYHTQKETEGISRIRINHETIDDTCNENREVCPKFILYNFTKSKTKKCKVEKCINLQKNVFKGAEQKMVDTLIACDIISLSEDTEIVGLLLLSDDQDHFPSLALASNRKTKHFQNIILGLRNETKVDFVSEFLKPFNIKTIHYGK